MDRMKLEDELAAWVTIETANGEVQIDPYEANDVLVLAWRKHGDSAERSAEIRDWLADKLGVSAERIPMSKVHEFSTIVQDKVTATDEAIKKKHCSTASSPSPIQASPADTSSGPSPSNEAG